MGERRQNGGRQHGGRGSKGLVSSRINCMDQTTTEGKGIRNTCGNVKMWSNNSTVGYVVKPLHHSRDSMRG